MVKTVHGPHGASYSPLQIHDTYCLHHSEEHIGGGIGTTMNTGILREVHADRYGFKMSDMTVAAMLKAYLQEMKVEEVPDLLSRIVSPGMRDLRGGTVKERGLEQDTWTTIDGAELAELIDDLPFKTTRISGSKLRNVQKRTSMSA